ncbi:putative ribonuclease H-like domain-containing protein [Tanacetum coccineum]
MHPCDGVGCQTHPGGGLAAKRTRAENQDGNKPRQPKTIYNTTTARHLEGAAVVITNRRHPDCCGDASVVMWCCYDDDDDELMMMMVMTAETAGGGGEKRPSTQGAAGSSTTVENLSDAVILILSFFAIQQNLKKPRLLVFKKNESVYEEDIKLLKREIYLRDLDIKELKRKLELATKEKDEVQLTVQKFENSSKSLSKLLDSQIMDKCKTGLRYNAAPPPYTRNFMPPKLDLVYPSLDDFVDVNVSVSGSIVEKLTVETNEPKSARKENGAPIIKDRVSESEEEDVPKVKTVEMFNKPSFSKINFVKSTMQIKSHRKTSVDKNRQNTPSLRGNKRNWKQQMSQKLWNDFEMFNKACHVCGSFDHLKNDCNNWYNNRRSAKPVWTNVQRVNKQNSSKLNHPSPKKNMVPRTVLTRSGTISLNTARPINTVHSKTTVNNAGPMKNVNTVKGTRVNTASPKAVFSDVKGNKGNAVKASACWVWKPKHKVLDYGNPQQELKIKGLIEWISKAHDMKQTKSYHDYKEIDGNFVSHWSVDLKNVVPQGGSGPNWLFDINALTKSINYKPVVVRNQSNGSAGTKACDDAGKPRMETIPGKDYILLPLWTQDPPLSSSLKDSLDNGFKPSGKEEKKDAEDTGNEDTKDNVVDENIVYGCADDLNMPDLEEISRFSDAEDDISGADMNNLDTYFQVSHVPTTRIHKDHPIEKIIGDLNSTPQTRRIIRNLEEHGFLKKPKKVVQALKDPGWIEAMQEELLQFKLQKVWTLVELPNGKRAIGTKWVFRNKKDERDIVIKNKARLVSQGYTQEEGIDYDEVFALVARIEAIRLFLAYASFKDFVMYQMDIKIAFLYGKIEEEVYVCQPPSFEDPDFPDRVYKVEKALYGLHQAPRAWYETLSTYLLDNGFQRGKIDKTLFIRRDKGDILLVQVYVDDIIFGSTKKSLCTEFEKMMHKKFQMSSMGELTFFLGLQVKQKEDGIFISQDKYVTEILKKFGFIDVKTTSTPMETQNLLLKDEDGEEVDVHLYRSMIGSLMYLTSSRPDIMFAVYVCARYQVNPKYPKDSPFDLVAYTDIDYAGASLDRMSTTRATNQKFNFSKYIFESMGKNLENVSGKFLMYPRFVQVFLEKELEGMSNHKRIYVTPSHTKKIFGNMRRVEKGFSRRKTPLFPKMMVQSQEEIGKGSSNPTDPNHTPTIIQPSTSQPQKKQRSRRPKRKDTEVPQPSGPTDNVADEAVYKEMDDSLERAATPATSLDA